MGGLEGSLQVTKELRMEPITQGGDRKGQEGLEGRWNSDYTAGREFPLKRMKITPLPCFLKWKEGDRIEERSSRGCNKGRGGNRIKSMKRKERARY